ncbi:hypothetical protein CTRI78_v011269 [Colletotrichum trifolii]|uniref:Rhodopsin domain-containing protein n=1 Tax=Colletotrichum trifolii TaxID=5466 RepID=A0A4R8QD41_COLTR|nr:hypothetical protein CTRI78_v011269 [Colletotrichum trifolii]
MEEGQRISQIAHTLPQLPTEAFTTTIQAITYVFCVLSTLIIFLRTHVRWKLSGSERAWGWDDILALAGWAPLLPSAVFLILATNWGLGAHDSQIPDGMLPYYQVKVKEYMFYFEIMYFASSVLTKFAMAIMIIRLCSSIKIYTCVILVNVAVLGVNAVVCMIIIFVSCSPLPAMWNEKL